MIKLYRRNTNGKPAYWSIEIVNKMLVIQYGVVGGINTKDEIPDVKSYNSRIRSKKKEGYLELEDIVDECDAPVEESLYQFLDTYLPKDRVTADNTILAMLAKTYDNENNKVFDYKSYCKIGNTKIEHKGQTCYYYAQPKINGLRCIVGIEPVEGDLFIKHKYKLISREGTVWEPSAHLTQQFDKHLSDNAKKMLELGWYLDGEFYIKGETVNDINSAVKSPDNPLHKKLTYHCFDVINEYDQLTRLLDLAKIDDNEFIISVHTTVVSNHEIATILRNEYIEKGYEGLILRHPYAKYNYGGRKAKVLIKYKKHTDGIFKVLDVIPEGDKRPDVGVLLLKNDINENTFIAKISDSIENQRHLLVNKDAHIGKEVLVEYGERSGVSKVPFHIKHVSFRS